MGQNYKTISEEHYSERHTNSVNGSTHHKHNNNEHYTSDIPAVVPPVRKQVVSKTKVIIKQTITTSKLKQREQHLNQYQDNKYVLDDHDQIKQLQRLINNIKAEDETTTVTTVSSSTSMRNTYYDITESITAVSDTESRNTIPPDDDENRGNVVRFDMNSNTQYEIESRTDYTNKERRNYWWNDHEKEKTMDKLERQIADYEQRQRRQRKTTKSSSSKKTLQHPSSSSSSSYFRGFECWTTMGSFKRENTIKQCRCVVMYEQNKQWNDENNNKEYDSVSDYDYYDPIQIIANWSMKVTKESARRARLNGMEDAQEASQMIGDSWVIKKDGDRNSTGAKEGSIEVHPRNRSFQSFFQKGGKNISNNEEDTTLSLTLKSNASFTTITSKKIITKKKKNLKKIIATTTNNEDEKEGAVSTTTTTNLNKAKQKTKSTSMSTTTTTTTKQSSSEDPPGSRLLIQEEE